MVQTVIDRVHCIPCRLELNHFADWTRAEYRAVMLPNNGAPRLSSAGDPSLVRQHVRSVPVHMVPSTLDWRGSPADSPVKDQAMCGGCWVSLLLPFH